MLASERGRAGALAAALEKAVVAHTGGLLTDDLAAVVLRVPGEPSPSDRARDDEAG